MIHLQWFMGGSLFWCVICLLQIFDWWRFECNVELHCWTKVDSFNNSPMPMEKMI